MATFPTLSISPEFPLVEGRENNVISSKMEAGYMIRRARFTKVRRNWNLQYKLLTNDDKTTLDTFVGTTIMGGATTFTWIHPATSDTFVVFLDSPPEISLDFYGDEYRYSTNIKLVEA